MEDLSKAANYHLETASEDYKKRAQKAIDDGESLEDFYVRETKRCIRKCDVCSKVVVGFYFCCTKCELFNEGYNYNLCVDCFYGGRTFEHNHDTFADNHSLLMMHSDGRGDPTCVIEKNNGKGKQDSNSKGHTSSSPPKSIPHDSSSHSKSTQHDLSLKVSGLTDSIHSMLIISNPYSNVPSSPMSICSVPAIPTKIKIDEDAIKKLAKITDAHYNAAPDYIRAIADKFFWNMVKQEGKTSVTMEDFVESMKEKGYLEYAYPELFEMVVKDRNVGMDITESRTVYYIVVSGRPFCSWCKYLIPDIFFCCSKCPARTYALCLDCYSIKAYVKEHPHYGDGDAFFLDYTVLHNTIKATPADTSEVASGSGSSSSTAIEIRKPRDDKVVASLKAGRAILNAGAAVLSIASTLGACTIL